MITKMKKYVFKDVFCRRQSRPDGHDKMPLIQNKNRRHNKKHTRTQQTSKMIYSIYIWVLLSCCSLSRTMAVSEVTAA